MILNVNSVLNSTKQELRYSFLKISFFLDNLKTCFSASIVAEKVIPFNFKDGTVFAKINIFSELFFTTF